MLTIRIKFLFSTSRKTVCIFKTNHRDYKTMINTESATKVFLCYVIHDYTAFDSRLANSS